jgi:ABC-2 type transport system permease protein
MGAILAIAANDLRRRLRDRTALATAFIAPFVLSALMGLAFGSGNEAAQVRIAVVDAENTAVTRAHADDVLKSLALGPLVSVLRTTDGVRAHQLFVQHRVSASVTLQPGSSQMIKRLKPVPIVVEASRTRPLGRAVAQAFVAGSRLRQATGVVLIDGLRSAGLSGPQLQDAVISSMVAPPVVRIGESNVPHSQNPLGFFAPSMAIVFLFLSVGFAANSVLAERATGTMTRMQAAPIGLGAVVAGKTLSILGLMLMSVLSLWGATSLVFHAHWGQPLAVLVLCVATVAAIGALGLFVTVSARTEAGAQSAAAGVAFVFALLGGNFFPPGSLPPLLEKLALLTPNGWSLDGFTTLSLDGGGLADVLVPVGVLVAMAVVIGGFALGRFRRAVAA